jgi:hypothetical protein
MKSSNETSFAAFVGIDWADLKHDVCLQQAEFVRDREDQMMVRAGDQSRALTLQPPLGRERLALRTAALVARVVECALHVSLRTAAHVTPELSSPAMPDPECRAMHIGRKPMMLRIAFEMRLKYLLQRAFHLLRNAHFASLSLLPSAVALVPPA